MAPASFPLASGDALWRPWAMAEKIRVLFVCLGNICRSPLAEGVFRHQVEAAGLADRFAIGSAGTGGWHEGKPPDERMCATARRRGLDISHQRARQLQAADVGAWDLVLVMDRSNLSNVRKLAPDATHGRLFRSYDPAPDSDEVPDPYYGGPEGFEEVFDIVERTSASLLEALRKEHGL